jgi:hypothetical protein
MSTSSNFPKHSRRRWLPLAVGLVPALSLLVMVTWLAAPSQQSDDGGDPAGEGRIVSPGRKAMPVGSADSAKIGSPPDAAPQASSLAGTGTPVVRPAGAQAWNLTADAAPRSHRQKEGHTSRRKPLRSARVEIADGWMDAAAVGAPVTFDLGEKFTARGTFVWAHREDIPGVKVYAGTLESPPGQFHLEHSEGRGWAGGFRLTDSREVLRLVPDRFEPGVSRLELWPEKETVCAGADIDGDPKTAPPADPGLDHTNLQSRPGAENVLYIDFNGETVSGTKWNIEENSFNDIVAAPSGMTRDEIIAAWARAAEDWITFDVNVTTSRSVHDSYAWHSRAMIVCTPTKFWYTDGEAGIGGVAWHDSFNNSTLTQICWCFNVSNYLVCAETISHEFGHMMGNNHASWESASGNTEEEYYEGHETVCGIAWAPIMGWSPAAGVDGLTQFSRGEYPGSTNDEDQLDEIAYELGALPDDHYRLPLFSQLTMTGTSLKVKGLMNSGGDVDSFMVELPAGEWRVSVEPNPCGPNVDCKVELRTSPFAEPVRESNNQRGGTNSLTAEIDTPAAGGVFWISVGSDACGGVYSSYSSYSSYGGVGSYTLTIKRPDGFESAAPALTAAVVSGLTQGSSSAEVEVMFTDRSRIDKVLFFRGESVFLERTTGGVSVKGEEIGYASVFTDESGSPPVSRAKQKFRFAAPGGRWDVPEEGSYQVRVEEGAAVDKWGNASAAATRSAGTLAADTTAPEIRMELNPIVVPADSDEPVEVAIVIDDVSPILITGNGAAAFEALSASGAAPITAQRSGYTVTNGGRRWTMVYLVNPPGGTWDSTEAGQWSFQVKSGQVRDNRGNITTPTGTNVFSVQASIFLQDFEDVTPEHGFKLATGWETGFASGTSLPFEDPSPSDGNATRYIGYALTSPRNYADNLDERSAATPIIDTEGYEGLSLRFRRWLTLRPGDNARIDVNDASDNDAWTTIWRSPQDRAVNDQYWIKQTIKLPSFVSNGALRVRWVMGTTDGSQTAGGWNVDDVEILTTGTWQPSKLVLAGPSFWLVQEGGSTLSYTVRLNQQPAQPVAVNLSPGADLSVNDTSLSFTAANWSVPQTVIVTAVNDTVTEGTEQAVIRHSCSSRDPGFAGVTMDRSFGVADNDAAIIQTQPADVLLLPGASSSFTVTPAPGLGLPNYQWYRGLRGNLRSPVSGGTNATLSVTLSAGATEPQLYWVRVRGFGNRQEDSRQVSAIPLAGGAAFRARLTERGYTPAQLNAPAFNDADPDKNGLTHFAELALGLLPGDAPRWALNVEAVPSEGGYPGEVDLLVTLPRLQPGVLYRLQSTADSLSWKTEAELQGSAYSEAGPVIRVPGRGDSRMLVRLNLSAAP